jgi:DNA-binding protein HU-beta
MIIRILLVIDGSPADIGRNPKYPLAAIDLPDQSERPSLINLNIIVWGLLRAARTIKKIMAKMTKAQITAALAEKLSIKKSEVANFFDTIASLAYSEVKKNGEFVLPGFGKVVKVQRKERMGRNPATGESIKIPAKTVVKFRLSKAAKEAVL